MLKKVFIILLVSSTSACASLPKSRLLGAGIGLGLGVIIGKMALNLKDKERLYKAPTSHRHRLPNQETKTVCLPHRGPKSLIGYGWPLCPTKEIFNFGFILGPLIGYYLSPKVHYYLKKREQKEFLIDLKENMIELPQSFDEDLSFLDLPQKRVKKIILAKKIKKQAPTYKKTKLKKTKLSLKANNWNKLDF